MTHIKNNYKNIKDKKIFGFWIYLMSDCILFAALFAAYAVLKNCLCDVSNKNVFEINFVLLETIFLLLSSISYGMVIFKLPYRKKNKINFWLGITFILGSCFIYLEIYEFYHLIIKGYSPSKNAFFSSFFTLVGTHGVHVIAGLIWIIVMIVQINYNGFTKKNEVSLKCLSLFWHFLDIIWICVYSIVYLIGAL